MNTSALGVTVYTKHGGPLTKQISLDDVGAVKSDGSACLMSRGSAQRLLLSDMGALADTIRRFLPANALSLGQLRPDHKPAFALLDYDTKGMPDANFAAAKAELEKYAGGDAARVFVDLVLAGELAVDEIEMLRDIAAQRSGATKGTLNAKLKAAKDEAKVNQDRIKREQRLGKEVSVVDEFNKKYAVVNETGIAVVYENAIDHTYNRKLLTRYSFSDLEKLYMNRLIDDTSVAEIWLNHPQRREYLGGVVFVPRGSAPENCWNLWTGFPVEPMAGDWSLMQHHIEHVICSGNKEHFDYLLNWAARMFQMPDKQGEVAVVLRGEKGAGKGIFCSALKRAWGQHGIQITNAKHLVGNFNAHLRDCVLLFADEAFFAADKQHESVLKGLVTEEFLPIEAKYQNLVEVQNMLHIIMSSNSEWVVPATHDEQRYFVLDVASDHRGDDVYFGKIVEQMESDGLAAMIYDLLHRDIGSFKLRAIPKSGALSDQKLHSLDSLDRWWLDVLSREFVWRSKFGAPIFAAWRSFISTELLWRSYTQWCAEHRTIRQLSREVLGKRMNALYAKHRPRGAEIIGEVDSLVADKDERRSPGWIDQAAPMMTERPNGYRVGSVEDARKAFTSARDIVGEWQQSL